MHRLPPSSTRPHTLCPSTTRFRSMINAQQTHIPLIFSEPGLDIAGPVGLDDVSGLILAALGASPVSRGIGGPVFQYIGSLESPLSRSEERSVGKECGRTGRLRWSGVH